MRMKSFVVAALGLALASGAAEAWYGAKGNDTGGIIPWHPETEAMAKVIASEHCSHWRKFAVITSVRRVPGDYIVYVCRFPRDRGLPPGMWW